MNDFTQLRNRGSNFFAEASLSVRGSLGEVAVGFTFAPSVDDESGDKTGPPSSGGGGGLWPVFVLHGNGSVYCLVTGLGSSKPEGGSRYAGQGCQMPKFDPFLSLHFARVEGVGAQSKEREGSNFAAQRSGAIVLQA